MKQCESMHQLECRAGVDHSLVVGVATSANKSPMAKSWPQAFAAGQHQARNLINRLGQIGVESRPPCSLGIKQQLQAGVYPTSNVRERRWRCRHTVRLRHKNGAVPSRCLTE